MIVHTDTNWKVSGIMVEKRWPKLQYTASHSTDANIISPVENSNISPESFSSGLKAVEVPALKADEAEALVVVLLFIVTGLPSRERYHLHNGTIE